ncbi:hypothetical protein LTR78_010223 [Recurvomyces mirabilis]|uniref:Uncharacterized protein n=1 Tax=Recurvomyces mirabilis TaxID=574656 RepID=A0AAE0TQG8_9PEZI|nr:hypothetical protein LTR78_010223 [Recurvomyces mirabilis]KAK5149689.1 hypothetical protein LTS14_010750 [Recurvomyces mirabilis]
MQEKVASRSAKPRRGARSYDGVCQVAQGWTRGMVVVQEGKRSPVLILRTPFITKSKMTPSYPRTKSSPPHAVESKDLPTSFRDNENTLRPPHEDWDVFLEQELSVQGIDEVFDHLWLVGRPYPPRSITIQNVLGRERVPVPDATLQLVRASSKIYIKPLPRYLLAESFYDQYLTPSSMQRTGPGRDGLGLLFSYLTLVPTETDFDMAQKDHLMPSIPNH